MKTIRLFGVLFMVCAALLVRAADVNWDNPAEAENNAVRIGLVVGFVFGGILLLFAGRSHRTQRPIQWEEPQRRTRAQNFRDRGHSGNAVKGSGIHGRSNLPLMTPHPRDWKETPTRERRRGAPYCLNQTVIDPHDRPSETWGNEWGVDRDGNPNPPQEPLVRL